MLELLIALGEDPEREGLRDTPARVSRAMQENFAGLWSSPEEVLTTTFDAGHRELIIVRDIEVFLIANTISHHFMELPILVTYLVKAEGLPAFQNLPDW